MTCIVGSPEETSRLTFCTSEPRSSWLILTSIPVRSLKGLRLAAMAEVGAVFSEIKLSVMPLYCFHMPPDEEPWLDSSPQPTSPSKDAPASPAPDIFKKSRRLNPPEIRIFPDSRLSFAQHPCLLVILARGPGTRLNIAPSLAVDVPWQGYERRELVEPASPGGCGRRTYERR